MSNFNSAFSTRVACTFSTRVSDYEYEMLLQEYIPAEVDIIEEYEALCTKYSDCANIYDQCESRQNSWSQVEKCPSKFLDFVHKYQKIIHKMKVVFTGMNRGSWDMRANEQIGNGEYHLWEYSCLEWVASAGTEHLLDLLDLRQQLGYTPYYEFNSGIEAVAAYSNEPINCVHAKSVRKAWAKADTQKRLWAYILQINDPNLTCKLLNATWVAPLPCLRQLEGLWSVQTFAAFVGYDRFLNLITKEQTLRIQGEEKHIEQQYVHDIFKMWELFLDADQNWLNGLLPDVNVDELRPRFGRLRSIQGLHDDLARQVSCVLINEDLSQPELNPYDGKTLSNGLTVVVPKDTRTLALWGNTHEHCVGTYGKRIKDKESLVCALYHGDNHIYTASWSPQWQLSQIMGPRNSHAPTEVWDVVRTEIF